MMKDSGGYKKVASVDTDGHQESPEPSPTIVVYPPATQCSDGASIQFAKAAFLFKDKLDDVRKKRTEMPKDAAPAATSPPQTALQDGAAKGDDTTKGDDEASGSDDPIEARRLLILHLAQTALTSLLSIAIAALQGKAYVRYLQTKDTPGAWPKHPNLLPTILLMVIAVLAGTLDLSVLMANIFRSHAKTFFGIATKSFNILTCVKGVSYALVSVVCRGSFNYGKSSGQKNDLWGWTCSAAADKFDSVTQAGANCTGQVDDASISPLGKRATD
jgi:hypothetical protein